MRIVTYPNEAVRQLADHLCDMDYNLPGDEALEVAQGIVIDVTSAVDRLRAVEHAEAREQARRELLAEIDAALRSDGAAMHHSSCWRNAGFGEACGSADFASAGFMADFIAQRFKP